MQSTDIEGLNHLGLNKEKRTPGWLMDGVSVNSSLVMEPPWVGWEWGMLSPGGVKWRNVGF